MADKKIIAVVGATGTQGGALVRAILSEPYGPFTVRALTRDVNSEKAQELKKLGAEVVAADIDNLNSLKLAFHGVYGVYCVTFYWEHCMPEREMAQAAAMAQAAKNAGATHVIWSTLEDTRKLVPLKDTRLPTIMGKYKVPHFDGKGASNDAFRQIGLPTSYLLASFYWENLIYMQMGPKKQADGTLVFALPLGDKRLPGIAAEDIGKCAFGVFKRGVQFVGKTVGIAGEHLTGMQMAAAMTRTLRQKVVYKHIPFEEYRALDFPAAQDLTNMFQFQHDFEVEFCAARNVELSRSLNPSLLSFDGWLLKYKDGLQLA
ncbi:MAG: NmrA/HSCARG family protein [Betaproteobacteria bacterium]|nr:NmrA/HSCARG family protein [Betaproteobacteria bacterium]MDH3437822.1 NmrA/HSCARG family protein [Betaproteobacteria bacterium]